MIYKTLLRKLKIEQSEPHKKLGSKLRCSGRVSMSCSTSGTRVEVNQDITQYSKSFKKTVKRSSVVLAGP